MNKRTRTLSIVTFIVLGILSCLALFNLKFGFDLEQFFPEGDEDLVFYREFIDEFERDDNFMLLAVRRDEGVFEQQFLEQFHELTLKASRLPHINSAQSLTKFSYPLKTPFGITSVPAIHIDKPQKYEKDKSRILQDERFVNNLISEDATTLVISLKTTPDIAQGQAEELITSMNSLMASYDFDNYHYIGRSYFQVEMVRMQKREVLVSALISWFLVSVVMMLTFQRIRSVMIALVSIGLGMLIFMGFLGATGRELNAMAALYPVLMIIVGTSDVIHIMSKYIDELRKGIPKKTAIIITIKQIGIATLLTSLTTAIGFASLATSKVVPIRDFGINAAVGVLIAYITVIFFTTALLSFYEKDQLIKHHNGAMFWSKWMNWFNNYTKYNVLKITTGVVLVFVLALLGISKVGTNYNIVGNLPEGKKVTEDFLFFEKEFSGFRPMELAVFVQGDYKINDYEVIRQIDTIEQHLRTYEAIRTASSITALYKTINQMSNGNKQSAYQLTNSASKFKKQQKLASKLPNQNFNLLVSKDQQKARISTRVLDVGADTFQGIGNDIDTWIAANTDPSIVKIRRTGTGMLFDKNANYIRKNLLQGLGLAMFIVSILMVILFRNIKLLIISLIPNVFPLLLAGALLGYAGIELEAGIAIVFAIIFGIAVDDTIHFLSKFKLARQQGMSVDDAIQITYVETGKAICLTSIILFFGFLVMLFSVHPPSVRIGVLVSLTLFSALFSDLLIIPILIRWLIKDNPPTKGRLQEKQLQEKRATSIS